MGVTRFLNSTVSKVTREVFGKPRDLQGVTSVFTTQSSYPLERDLLFQQINTSV